MSGISLGIRAGRIRAVAGLTALLLTGAVAWSCASPVSAGIGLATSSVSRAPGSPEAAVTGATSVDAFGFDLYRKMAATPGNLVFSPASVALALAMAEPGARGETAAQMDAVLHIGSGASGGNGLGALDGALGNVSGQFPDAEGVARDVTLRIANATFGQSGMPIQQAYLDALASRFGAGLRLVDYSHDAAGACKLIDDWVGDQTEKRIPKLLDQLDPATRLVLVNAIYLKAPWLEPFVKEATADADFTLLDGKTVRVPMMSDASVRDYAAGAGWQAADLAYVGGSLAMTVVVPDDLASFEKGLDAATFAAIEKAMQPTSMDLAMPRFTTETKMELKDILAALGMPLAMDPDRADFSGITSAERLVITHVVHQANISVDEKGTEAAATTAVVMATATAAPVRVNLRLDRPFVFAIRDTKTGAILFLGRIVDPSAA